jgi:isoleucyl-tRNA synthetase
MSVFKPVDTTINFPQSEAATLKFWKENKIFEKSLQLREGVKDSKTWVFYEGPPTANGKPHPGHVLTRVVKDLFPRYKTMCGYYVPRKAGWDTHGLPVEIEVEKELKLDGKSEVEKYGVEPFVRKCMDSVFRYTTDWEKLTEKIGFWIDLKDAYVTYHQPYVESVWWSLKELHERNLFYKGHKILPWCPHCQTALSQNEVALGYQEVEDPSVFVTFRDVNWDQNKTSFLAWTTTPWTLPCNAGLAVKADTEYSYVKVGDETLIMASALVKNVMGKLKFEVTKTEPGSALVGRKFQPLFNWADSVLTLEQKASAWKVCAADFVTLDTGSGIVHIAPAFGADDYALGQKEGLPTIQLVGPDGKFLVGCGNFSGRFVKEADSDLIRDLKERKLLLKRENYKHDYPFCWRCKSPLIYFARGGWFIRTTREIQHVIENNQCVDWHPEHIKEGRFGSFLGGNVDWALSRERYWGTPLNIWVCECGNQEAVGSFAELQKKPNAKGLDAFDIAKKKDPTLNDHLRVHKPWIDAATFSCSKCNKEMKRTTEVIDCWYDSGAMPFAQWGYPHAPGSKEKFNLAWPADFISEAIDQTRGWFYTLMAESTLLKDSFEKTSGAKKNYPVPYKTCVVLGHVCDEFGKKISKSNPDHRTPKYDPNSILDEEGADALRWFFYASNAPWNNMRFSRPTVRETQKEFLLKLRNVYSFFTIYANIDGFKPHSPATTVFGANDRIPNLLDRWIASELHSTIKKVRASLDDYDIFSAATALNEFVEALSNWHVRRSRERFWASWEQQIEMPIDDKNIAVRLSNKDFDKLSAYWTLYSCLVTLSQMIAPFVPFMAEDMWQNLVVNQLNDQPPSVHLSDYPEANEAMIDPALSAEVALVRECASLGRAARSQSKLKTRQPLAKVVVVLSDASKDTIVRKHEQVLLDELNVKKIEIAHQADQFVNYELKPNFKAIGSKFRESVPLIKEALSKADAASLRSQLAASGTCALALSNGKSVDLTPEEVEVSLKAKEGYAAASGKTVVVVLDTHLTPELLEEGVARELVNRVNGWRSELNLKYEQRIKLALKGSPKLEAVAQKFADFIKGETLATEQKVGDLPAGWKTLEIEVDGEKAIFAMEAV